MDELNELTQRLFSEGYTKENHPDGVRPFDPFYGGFTYQPKTLYQMVFETPCGLLVAGGHFVGGVMSFMGIHWMPENNNPVVACPRFVKAPCERNHPLLRERRGEILHCACPTPMSRAWRKPMLRSGKKQILCLKPSGSKSKEGPVSTGAGTTGWKSSGECSMIPLTVRGRDSAITAMFCKPNYPPKREMCSMMSKSAEHKRAWGFSRMKPLFPWSKGKSCWRNLLL